MTLDGGRGSWEVWVGDIKVGEFKRKLHADIVRSYLEGQNQPTYGRRHFLDVAALAACAFDARDAREAEKARGFARDAALERLRKKTKA